MLVLGHDHGNMAVGSIVLSVVPIGKLIGTRKSEFAGTPPLAMGAAPIAYSVARYGFAAVFHGAGIWCSDGQNLNLAVG